MLSERDPAEDVRSEPLLSVLLLQRLLLSGTAVVVCPGAWAAHPASDATATQSLA